MKAALVIFRRELGAYFNAPLAYVVAIAYMLLSSGLYLFVPDFWAVGQVSMRGFFDWVSWTICLVVPAITMRSWAEDRRGATYELLLTFPMRSIDLVAGKFLAALVFYLFCLSGSLVVPFVLWTLSTPGLGPDWGAIAAAYLGTLLAASLLIALGLFVSGLCRDQIEAFIVTLVVALAVRLLGFGPLAGQLEARIPWLGNFLHESVSFTLPLGRFSRGLVDLADVLFFLTWTAAFLFLNGIGLETRQRRATRTSHVGAIALVLPIAALLGGLWLEFGLPRIDMTADRIFTVSDAAGEVLRSIPEEKPVRLRLYFSPKDEMPTDYRTLERDVLEKIEAFQRRARGRLVVDTVHLHADDAILRSLQQSGLAGLDEGGDEERGEVETKLLQEGVVPFRVHSGGLAGSETKVVYAALALTHGASKKEIIPELRPNALAALEQELITRVYRLVHEKQPVVGLLAPIQRVDMDPQQLQLLSQLGIPLDQMPQEQDDYRYLRLLLEQGEQYRVRRLRPEDEQPLPDDLDTLVVVRPEGLSERSAWEIARFLHEGGSVVVAAQAFDSGLRRGPRGPQVVLQPIAHGLEGLLGPAGVSVPDEMVLNEEAAPVTYSLGPFSPPVPVDYRWIFAVDASQVDQSTSLANGVAGFLVESASPVRVDEERTAELGLEVSPVITTPETSWTRPVPRGFVPADLNDRRPAEGPLSLATLLKGQFPAPEAEPPAWSDPGAGSDAGDEGAAVEFHPAPGRLLVMGTARPLLDDILVDPRGGLSGAGVFLKNAVDALSLGDVLLRLTLREPRSRPVEALSRGATFAYEVILLGLAPAAYLALGMLRLLGRRRLQQRPYVPASAGDSA